MNGREPLSEELGAKIDTVLDRLDEDQELSLDANEREYWKPALRDFAREVLQPTTKQILAPMDDPANDGLLLSEKIEKCLHVHGPLDVCFQCFPHQATEAAVTFLRKQCDLSDARALRAESALLASQESARSLAEALEGTTHALKVIGGGGWDLKDKAQAVRLMQQVASNALEDAEGLRAYREAGRGKP